jgi:L-amino acid N-acyltransferase YncA
VIIRHADPARDSEGCAAVYAPYVRDSAISFEQDPPDAAEMSRRIERVSARYPWLVAEEDGSLAGYAYATEHRTRAAYRWTCEVAVYIAASSRGRGLGRALYEALLDLLTRQGLRLAVAGITLPNEASVALHQSCGFEPVGTFHRIGWKRGGSHDVSWWERELIERSQDPPAEPGPPARLPEPV